MISFPSFILHPSNCLVLCSGAYLKVIYYDVIVGIQYAYQALQTQRSRKKKNELQVLHAMQISKTNNKA